MTKRFETQAIEQLAGWVAEGGLAFEADDTLTCLKRINASDEGFTLEFPAPLNGTVRHEQVHLSDDVLRAAAILGDSWLMGEHTHSGEYGIMTISEARTRAQQ